MPLARAHVRRRYGRSALGDVQPGDELLIVTFPHQNELVFQALRRALLEIGVGKVDRIDVTDLGMQTKQYSAADGWREITDRLPPMIEEGVEFNVAAAALKRFLDDRPGYTGVYAGEAGRSHWKRAAGKRIRNNWVYATYEDFVGRANGVPDEIWRTVDLMVVDAFRNAAAVRDHQSGRDGHRLGGDRAAGRAVAAGRVHLRAHPRLDDPGHPVRPPGGDVPARGPDR